MLVTLRAENFRNLAPLAWSPGDGQHLILGDNGSGKTSLLEAIYVVATTRSFRTPQLRDCCRSGTAGFALGADAIEAGARAQLTLRWSGGGRERALNGRQTSLGEHLAALPVLAWSEAEADVLIGPPATRRRFLDRGMVAERPLLLDTLSRYQRALRAKRLVLLGGGGDLAAWNDLLAEFGAALVAARAAYLERLEQQLHEILAAHDARFAGVELAYRPHPPEALAGSAALRERLERAEASERRRRLALVGPHRDDVVVGWRGGELRRLASAGERKSLGMFLLAAQAMVLRSAAKDPLLLLDDADAELDAGAVERVLAAFLGSAQVIATSSRPEIWRPLPERREWRVEEGLVQPR